MRITLLTLLLCMALPLSAQRNRQSQRALPSRTMPTASSTPQDTVSSRKSSGVSVRGIVHDLEANAPLEGATVKLTTTDSTLVTGTTTGQDGRYTLTRVQPGSYVLRVSFMGYQEQQFRLKVPARGGNLRVGDVSLSENTTMMKEAVVVGQMAEMTVSEDTVMYNADAFKLEEGAMVEDLLELLPGLVKEEEGKYTWNGKEVSQLLVDGKEFFGGNMNTTLKNLPADIISRVKAYDKQSDRARLTGIDDGEEKLVLDLEVKKQNKKGWFGNLEGGYGTHDRYNGRTMANHFINEQKASIVANVNNTRGNGNTDQQHVGITTNLENEHLEVEGDIGANFSQSSSQSSTSRQSFENKLAAYSNSDNHNSSRNSGMNLNYKLEWKIDSLTRMVARPRFSFNNSRSDQNSRNATFREDPYEMDDITDPLDQLDILGKSIGVNSRLTAGRSNGQQINTGISILLNRRMMKPGRNISFNADAGYGKSDNNDDRFSMTNYYRIKAHDGQDSIYHKTQYNDASSINRNFSVGMSYSEPIGREMYLQISYGYNYRFSDRGRTVSSIFDPLNEQLSITPYNYRDFPGYASLDTAQCNYTTNTYQNHRINLQWRINRQKLRLSVGANIQPQYNSVDYNKGGKQYDVSRSVVNASPQVNFRYRFSKQEQIDFRYNGSTGQPGITDLIPDTLSNADPLNIRLGNPGLKPSFSQNLQLNYRKSITELQRTYAANIQFRTTQNAVSGRTEYNEETGGRVTRPENINGNWNANASFNFNTAFRRSKHFLVNSNTQTRMSNNASYVYRSKTHETVKNSTRQFSVRESLRFTYRNDWLELNANGSFSYNHSQSNNTSARNLDTYRFNYGGSVVFQFPWNMVLRTNITQQSRRGYSSASMNTNELLWGFTLSQRLLKQKNLTLSVRAVDLLNQRDEVRRNISSTARTDTRTSVVHSYFLISANYRFGRFGGRRRRSEQHTQRPDMPYHQSDDMVPMD